MNVTLQRRLIHGASLSMLGVAVAGVAWALSDVGQPSTTSDANASGARLALAENASVQPSSGSDESVTDPSSPQNWSLPLQQSLYDPPKPAPRPPRPKPKPVQKPVAKPAAAKPPKLDWRLVGTLIEPGGRVAILADATGKTDIRGADEEVELSPPGVRVRKIDSEEVTLEIRGTPSTLRLQKGFGKGATNGNRSRGGQVRGGQVRGGQGRAGRGRDR